ncbi:NHLP bacteriocin system secretion protein [Methylobacterium fujisawaense]|uniref:NHLP bacteriocin system secretion protein n=1 Tax=Methylobacterium fujisawaense TaxID=107400 RepID=UPI00313CA725
MAQSATSHALFRPEAEAKLHRPDDLAGTLRLVAPGHFAALCVLCLAAIAAILGTIFVRVPISVTGAGVILSSKGVLEFTIAADHEGRVVEMLVDVGQRVAPGQAIARIVQPTLQTELKLAEGELDLVTQEQERVRTLQKEATRIFGTVRQQQESTSRETIDLLEQRRDLLSKLVDGVEALRKSGNATFERYLQVRADLAQALERIATEKGRLLSVTLESYEKQAQYERELQSLETRRAQAERQIGRLKDRISKDSWVRSTEYGIVSEMKVFPGDLIRFDTPLVSLLPVDESFSAFRPGSTRLVAAIFVPAKDGKKVRTGMPALIDPSSVRRDVFGSIRGVVTKTSDVAVSPEQMRHTLRNDDLVRKLTAEGPRFLMVVELERDPKTASGFRWTTSAGPDAQITAGTLLDGQIHTERASLLSLLIPALKELLRGPDQQHDTF